MKKRLRLNDPDDIFDMTLDSFVEEHTPAEPSKPTPKRRKWDILAAVDEICNIARNEGLDAVLGEAALTPINYLRRRFKLNHNEALFLALFINMSDDRQLAYSDFARFLNCSRIRVIRISTAIDTLVERRYVQHRHRDNNYWVEEAFIEACKRNEVYAPVVQKGLSCEELFDEIAPLAQLRMEDDIDFETFAARVTDLMDNNPHLNFVKRIKELNLVDKTDEMLLVWFCDMLINRDDEMIIWRDINQLVSDRRQQRRVRKQLFEGHHILFREGYVQYRNEDGMAKRDELCLTTKAKQVLLEEIEGVQNTEEVRHRNLIDHTTLSAKRLFYNAQETRQIERLAELLSPKNFDGICARLEEKGMRKGFACLFHGTPGTGKTETVMQLARLTGRDIMQVNIAAIKGAFVGESEKNIKAIFDRYRSLVKQMKVAPILLFNEADAIFGCRMERTERAVDKMENAIQNIILQEMESMEGILIATTNLTASLDPAFERRFIYKIGFSKPSIEAKCAIWREMLPELSEEEARSLAVGYDLSGGQIENVARKQAVEYILTGQAVQLTTLREFCDAERLSKQSNRRPMGF